MTTLFKGQSQSTLDSDSEDEHLAQQGHFGKEVTDHDRVVLLEEEEREQLISKKDTKHVSHSIFGRGHDNRSKLTLPTEEKARSKPREGRARRRRGRKEHTDMDSELMFEMEEGGKWSGTSSESSRSSAEPEKLSQKQTVRWSANVNVHV